MADTRTFPEVDFITRSASDIFDEMVETWEATMGRSLGKADPIRLILGWEASINAQLYAAINQAAKMNVPRFAVGKYLDSIAENYYYDLERLPASAATTTVRFTLSQTSASATTIPAGTRVTRDGSVIFLVSDPTEIPAGSLYADVPAECSVTGEIGNDYAIGSINICMDPDNVENLQSVSNITISEGGAAEESDSEFYERMRISLAAYSTAGAEKSYIYQAKTASALVGDATVTSPNPGYVTIYIMRSDGAIPGAQLISDVTDYLSGETVRPLTDRLTVAAPTGVDYDVTLTWYRESGATMTREEMEAAVEAALETYREWQDTKIGRDINPSKLVQILMKTGIKRVAVTEPTFEVIAANEVPQMGITSITYGGTEDG